MVMSLFGFLFLMVFFLMLFRLSRREEDIEVEETEEITHHHVQGNLKRYREQQQFYVIDPADRSKMWVNDTDDMYEDANGSIWRLV